MNDLTKKKIGTILNELLAEKGILQKELAEHIGVTPNTVSYYLSGDRCPDIDKIIEIANYLNVSTDYLLGITDIKSPDTELKAVCNYTGLSEYVINRLHEINSAISEEITDDVFAESLQARNESLKNRIDFYNFFLSNDDFLNAVEYSISYKDELSLINAYLKAYHHEYSNTPAEIGEKMLDFITDETYKLYRSTRLNFFEATEAFKKGLEAYTNEESKQYKKLDSFLSEAAEIIAQEHKEGE